MSLFFRFFEDIGLCIMTMTSTLMDNIRKETDKLDQELEGAHGEFDKTKAVLEKR